MEKDFLDYVAQDIIKKYGADLSNVAIVFPNKRASLFLNEKLAIYAGKPIWSPVYTTISELFREHSTLTVGDPIKLICDLHKSFTKCTGLDETLDHFYGWGQLLLSDFDDIDKNMGDAEKIFANLRDIHSFDDISYLTEEQRETLRKFFSTFNDNAETELKKRFENLWCHFSDIYKDYNERLEKQSLAYEGALYRKVAESNDIDFRHDAYLFVGFNMAQKVEQILFKKLKQQGKGRFYWDFDDYYICRQGESNFNEAGHYISQYLADFPNELDIDDKAIYDNIRKPKSIKFISAMTEDIQARYVGRWIKENARFGDGKRTAIVLCDESLLPSVLHNIPTDVEKMNITTGFPLSEAPVASIVYYLIDMQTTYAQSRKRDAKRLRMVLSHPYAKYISDECPNILKKINDSPYADISTLNGTDCDAGIKLLLSDMDNFTTEDDSKIVLENRNIRFNVQMIRWIREILKLVGLNASQKNDQFLNESVFQTFMIFGRMETLSCNGDLDIDLFTFRKLLKQIIDTTSIPFHGEPAIGIQVMGVLETRNIDFDHVLLLSCNEGNMPKGVNDTSFIPYSIRKAHGLTTIDNKVAIYSYYFHRLLQRTNDFTATYNMSTENGHTGEMSRFLIQLLVESKHKIARGNLTASNSTNMATPSAIEKSESVIETLEAIKYISPSAINKYIRCQLQFYFNHVAGIKEPDDASDGVVDNRIFGNIFHKAAYLIYERFCKGEGNGSVVDSTFIEQVLKQKDFLERIVDRAFNEELFKHGSKFTKSDYNGLQIINREVIISYLRQMLKKDLLLAPFCILGLEQNVETTIDIESNGKPLKIKVGGIIDRMDITTDKSNEKRIRIVDYKTGAQPTLKVASIDDVFSQDKIKQRHSDYFLQTMLYSIIVSNSTTWNKSGLNVSPALFFIKQTAKEEYDPVLSINDEKINDITKYKDDFTTRLKGILYEIFDKKKPFAPTKNKETCQLCPYNQICGL